MCFAHPHTACCRRRLPRRGTGLAKDVDIARRHIQGWRNAPPASRPKRARARERGSARQLAAGSIRPQRARQNTRLLDRAPPDQMPLDDLLEHGGIARPVPHPLGVDEGDRPALADPQAVGLGPQHPAPIGQPKLAQTALQIGPGSQSALALAALRRGLVGAEQNVPFGRGDPDRGGGAPLALDGALLRLGIVHLSTFAPGRAAAGPAASAGNRGGTDGPVGGVPVAVLVMNRATRVA